MSHALAGQTVTLRSAADPIQGAVVTGAKYRVEDYWTTISGGLDVRTSAEYGNWAAINYVNRAALVGLPDDGEVVYGKIGTLGHIVHVSEL